MAQPREVGGAAMAPREPLVGWVQGLEPACPECVFTWLGAVWKRGLEKPLPPAVLPHTAACRRRAPESGEGEGGGGGARGTVGTMWAAQRVGMGALLLYGTFDTVRRIRLAQDRLGVSTVTVTKGKPLWAWHTGRSLHHTLIRVRSSLATRGCNTHGTRGATQGTRGTTQGTKDTTQGTRGTTHSFALGLA